MMTLRESKEKSIREYEERPSLPGLSNLGCVGSTIVEINLTSRIVSRGIIGDSESNGRKVRPCHKYAIIASSLATRDPSRHGVSHAAPLLISQDDQSSSASPNRFDTRGTILNRVPVTLSPTSSVDYYFLIRVFVRILHLLSLISRDSKISENLCHIYLAVFRNRLSF